MKLALFYLARAPGGGSTSFAVHLYRALQLAGHQPLLVRPMARHEGKPRTLGQYAGVEYVNTGLAQCEEIVRSMPSVMVSACKARETPWAPDLVPRLRALGMWAVVHDPNEFRVYDWLEGEQAPGERMFCIRPTMHQFFPRAKLVLHPYVRRYPGNDAPSARELLAVSVARVSFVKRTTIILEANRLLKAQGRQQVVLLGAENRLYTRHRLKAEFPEFKQGSTGFPLTWHASAEACARATYAVDMTYFPQDGGGSQYSFMEAWDAGTANIIHEDWLRYSDYFTAEMHRSVNCIAVNGAQQLANVLASYGHPVLAPPEDLASVVQAGYDCLRTNHDPVVVANQYVEALA